MLLNSTSIDHKLYLVYVIRVVFEYFTYSFYSGGGTFEEIIYFLKQVKLKTLGDYNFLNKEPIKIITFSSVI